MKKELKTIGSWAMMALAALITSCNTATDMEQQIDELYQKMPQEERIAQLKSMYMDELFDADGKLDTAKCKELIPYGIGHFSQFCMQQPRDPNELRDRAVAIQDWLKHHTPNGIPALLHEEVLSGINTLGSTIYPQQIGQAGSFNPELAELKTRQTSTQLRKMGGIFALSPMVDVCRTPSFNRLEESYGEDGYLSAVMGTAFVNGLQQGDLKKGVGACSKHYLGYGGGGDADEKEMMEEILLPHETMIRLAGSVAVMPGYHDVHGIRCVANSEILQDILRGYVGFDGMVVSDYTAIDQIPNIDSAVEKAAAAINGGNDVDFPFGANYQLLQEAIDKGLVKPEVLERAVKNVLRIKFRAGLFDKDAYLYSKEDIKLDTPEERQTAYDIASQSIVLLENNGVLPLKDVKNVLITGPNANSIWAMCGDYTYPAMSYFWKMVDYKSENPHIVKLLEAMAARKPEGMNVLYSRGCDWTEEIETKFSELGDARAWEYELLHRKVDTGERTDKAEALRMAKDCDVIIAAVGENVMLCGENRDRQGLRLPGKQEEYVQELINTGKPVVLVMFGGRAQVISGIAEKCAAVIQAWYPGQAGGTAIADVIYGDYNPAGRLPVTFYKNINQVPDFEDYSMKGRTYRYMTEKPLFQFGYGLSYTNFQYGAPRIEGKNVVVAVTNTGKRAGDEVVQLYVKKNDEKDGPQKTLRGFKRVNIAAGQTVNVSIPLTDETFNWWDNKIHTVHPLNGDYTLLVGSSSADEDLQSVAYTF